MQWLNYHHLLYFWMVAREGSVVKAAAELNLTQPTISGQIKALEQALGEQLFQREGRGLVLTEVGRLVYRYADDIFALGRELLNTLNDRPTGRPFRLVVGVADVLPKFVVRRLLEPAQALDVPVHLICREDKTERLLAELSIHELDLVLADTPMPPGTSVKAFNHVLGESGIGWFAGKAAAARLRRRFPESLGEAPLLLPTSNTALRRAIDQWFDTHGIRPHIVGEFEDSALMKVFGEGSGTLFPGPLVVEKDIVRQHDVALVGRTDEIKERYFAISVEKKLRHPAVVAISEAARSKLFG
ncbi:MAG: transcriptional activator NhaR [Vicinamibacteraceae bacterium]|nr:transcriptional activator NhaR [Vicinamibacteraceae bacterium]